MSSELSFTTPINNILCIELPSLTATGWLSVCDTPTQKTFATKQHLYDSVSARALPEYSSNQEDSTFVTFYWHGSASMHLGGIVNSIVMNIEMTLLPCEVPTIKLLSVKHSRKPLAAQSIKNIDVG